jgi:hypothetical protein
MKRAVFWVATACSLVEVYRHFRGACCLHHKSDDRLRGATTQKTAISSSVFFMAKIGVSIIILSHKKHSAHTSFINETLAIESCLCTCNNEARCTRNIILQLC